MADYLEAFARESEEQITELNNALLEFEDDPTDQSAMEGIFRTAHTLKGNCGAMGFEPAEDLAHAIEDLLEAIRSNRVSVSPELMDAIFEAVDELDAMISEAVEEGQVEREADDVIEILREYATAEGVVEPTDTAIDELLDSVSAPTDSDHSVYHVRFDVAGDPAVHGRAVVDALDDAFELLGTDPDGDAIDAADYDGTIDAAFASVVTRAAVEAALEPVDAVDDQVITDVTDRVEADGDDGAGAETAPADGADASDAGGDAAGEAADLSVDELLQDEDVDQFDDLDEMAEEVGDTSEFEDLGDAGSFADLGITEDDVDIGTGEAQDAADADAANAEEAAVDQSSDEPADDEVEDASAEFAQLKEEVDPVGFDELQDELADLEFDEYDSDDEVGFDELLDEDELSGEGAFATVPDQAAEAPSASDDDAEEVADAEATADAGAPDATAEDLFGGAAETGDETATETADAETAASADATDAAAEAAPDATAASDDGAQASDDAAEATEDAGEVSEDAVAASASEASADEAEAPSADADDVAVEDEAADAAADVLDQESLDESAQSYGEGGLDLTEADEPAADAPATDGESDSTAEESVTTADADDLDLDDSFGEMEADAEADAEAAAAAADADADGSDVLDLGDDDIDFDAGTVAGAEATEVEEATDESVATGDALEDDSFDPDVTADALDADAGTVEADAVEPVEGFGDEADAVLDLDSGSVAAEEAPPEGDEETLESVDVADVGPGARVPDDADTSFESNASLDSGSPSDGDVGESEVGSDSFEDPGFSDEPETADDGPDVDEERLERIRSLGVPLRDADADARPAGTQSIRVDVDALDRMLNMVEGLVTSRARLRRALIENEPREVLEDELDDLEDVTSELQDTVMDVRLVPLRTAVNKLPRIVRDVAREEDKDVDFEMVGEDVELDRSILDEIGDPLVHLVRNAIDHGIETPDVREDAGKPTEGSVELRATRERDRVTIVVEDDGAGIDATAVRDAAVEEGIHTRSEVDSMDDEAVHELIFHAGFSTASEVTDVSGRGVGMDIVADTVDRLDGTVTVDSQPGEGTTITMELPVTLAIAEVLFVDVGGEEYGIPIKNVGEIGPVVGVETQDGQEVLVSDGGEDRRELIRLDEALSTPGRSDPNSGMLVHLRDDVREAAIHCDQVREQQEVVVKPFEGVLGDVPGLSGASVLGDGDVVTILDVETL